MVAKLQLRDLHETGSVVGRLSAWATAGALAGTFATGFVIVPLLAVDVAMLRGRRRGSSRSGSSTGWRQEPAPTGAKLVAGARCWSRAGRCGRRAVRRGDDLPLRARGGRRGRPAAACWCSRTCATPTWTSTIRATWSSTTCAGSATPSTACAGRAAARRGVRRRRRVHAPALPGRHPARLAVTVLEVDEPLVDLVRERLALRTGPDLRVRTGDARMTLRDEPTRLGRPRGRRRVRRPLGALAPRHGGVRARDPARAAAGRAVRAQRDRPPAAGAAPRAGRDAAGACSASVAVVDQPGAGAERRAATSCCRLRPPAPPSSLAGPRRPPLDRRRRRCGWSGRGRADGRLGARGPAAHRLGRARPAGRSCRAAISSQSRPAGTRTTGRSGACGRRRPRRPCGRRAGRPRGRRGRA